MRGTKSYIPVKLFSGYFVLAGILIAVGAMLFSEHAIFSNAEREVANENAKILKVNAFLSKVHESESLSRIVIQSGSEYDKQRFNAQYSELRADIDTLKGLLRPNQIKWLDSVRDLLARKKSNIDALSEIKRKSVDQSRVTGAIQELTRMEESLRKLRLEDFVKNPMEIDEYRLSILREYVDYLNEQIPDDETNTLSQKTLDSMLVASRVLLYEVRQEALVRNRLLGREEKKLLDNELQISTQLQHILREIEQEIITTTTRTNKQKALSMNRVIRFMTASAIAGFVLALVFSIMVLNDFLRAKKYKEQLEIANKRAESLLRSREQLISTVSHDLKTPLSTILGYTQLIEQTGLSAKQQYYNANIKSASNYIANLVQDFVEFTQIEAGKVAVGNVGFSLPEVIGQVSADVQAAFSAKPVSLVVHTDPEFQTRIKGDPFRLRQILTNLIQNAFKFTDSGTVSVRCRADETGQMLHIDVQDTGIGIAEDKLELIFEEFTQADASIEKQFGGTGLGLTISRKMAEILGGSLSVKSRPGQGTTFFLTLPLQWDEASTAAAGQKLRIALIDDDRQLLELATEFLQQRGHSVMGFSDATQALETLKNKRADVILTDVQMPEMDGFAFLERWKQSKFAVVPVIAVTGLADAGLEHYLKKGFSGLVRKPFLPGDLLTEIYRVLNIEAKPSAETANDEDGFGRLKAFFPQNPEQYKRVLQTFERDTRLNMRQLQSAIESNNKGDIQMIAHKMRPMFMQLGSEEGGLLLNELQQPATTARAFELFRRLKPVVEALLEKIRANQ